MNLSWLTKKLTTPSERLLQDIEKLDGDVMVIGAGGKMGPSLTILLQNALQQTGKTNQVFAVSRFSNREIKSDLEQRGVTTLPGDLLDEKFLDQLPKVKHLLYLAGFKFGAVQNAAVTWAMNSYLPGRVAALFSTSNIVAFSSGNIYPFVPVHTSGATEETTPGPIGEYAQSCLGRERMFEYFSRRNGTPTLIYRLNYALDLRYGVLNDIARQVYNQQTIDLTMGYANVIWQGDANEYALRCLLHCATPPMILNITGPEKLAVRDIAERFGKLFHKSPKFSGQPASTALLNDASQAHSLLGLPNTNADQLIDWTAAWILSDGMQLNKPTHFQERSGQF